MPKNIKIVDIHNNIRTIDDTDRCHVIPTTNRYHVVDNVSNEAFTVLKPIWDNALKTKKQQLYDQFIQHLNNSADFGMEDFDDDGVTDFWNWILEIIDESRIKD